MAGDVQDTDQCPGRTQHPGRGTPGPRSSRWLRMGGEGERCCWGTRAARRSLRAACAASPSLGPRQPLPQPEEGKGREEPEGLRLSLAWGQQLGKAPRSGQLWVPSTFGAGPGSVSRLCEPGAQLVPQALPQESPQPAPAPKQGLCRAPLLPPTHRPRCPVQPSELGSGHRAACPNHGGLEQRLCGALRAPQCVITACQHRGSVRSAPKHLNHRLPHGVTTLGAPMAPVLRSGPCACAAVPVLSPCLQPSPTALLGSAGLGGSTGPGFHQQRPRCTQRRAPLSPCRGTCRGTGPGRVAAGEDPPQEAPHSRPPSPAPSWALAARSNPLIPLIPAARNPPGVRDYPGAGPQPHQGAGWGENGARGAATGAGSRP